MSDRDIQYQARREQSGTWRIMDTWDEEIRSLDRTEEISDKLDGITLITEGQYLSIIKEATKSGYLASAALAEIQSLEAAVEELEDEKQRLTYENERLTSEVETPLDVPPQTYNPVPVPAQSSLSEEALIKLEIVKSLTGMAQGENLTGLL